MRTVSVETTHKQIIETVIDHVSNQLDDNITLEEMANIAFLSPFYFNRVFRKITGIPPKEFLSALRIEKSKKLLKKTNLRVTDICMDVGYLSMGTFTTRFTKAVGVSPKQYRVGKGIHHTDAQDECSLTKGVKGDIMINHPFVGEIYVGVFSSAIPSGVPINCTILKQEGSFNIPLNKNGEYTLFAAAILSSNNEIKDSNKVILQGSSGPFIINEKEPIINRKVILKPPATTDPPILVALPTPLTTQTIKEATK